MYSELQTEQTGLVKIPEEVFPLIINDRPDIDVILVKIKLAPNEAPVCARPECKCSNTSRKATDDDPSMKKSDARSQALATKEDLSDSSILPGTTKMLDALVV